LAGTAVRLELVIHIQALEKEGLIAARRGINRILDRAGILLAVAFYFIDGLRSGMV
jgi:hypothetical protein